ncbi:zinc finger protein 692 isoform X2 [Denticeps clupeoides]|uniref:zinc finger protein 692 isoform X2 n=1 Tax=Denticeps clupeoides TaxID=299321 RepID=UPI0010A3B8AA|nr:zinc finger protein 692-like isoform X2 [Denticeps clupeoides]
MGPACCSSNEAVMVTSKEAVRRQRRRDLDARRSKLRVRLGACLQRWVDLKDRLGFSLHSQLAQYLLHSYFSKVCMKCKGPDNEDTSSVITSVESLQQLVLLVCDHSRHCPHPLNLQPYVATGDAVMGSTNAEESLSHKNDQQSDLCLRYVCKDSHHFLWHPSDQTITENTGWRDCTKTTSIPSSANGRKRGTSQEIKNQRLREEDHSGIGTRSRSGSHFLVDVKQKEHTERLQESDVSSQAPEECQASEPESTESTSEAVEQIRCPLAESDSAAVPDPNIGEPQRKTDVEDKTRNTVTQARRGKLENDDVSQIGAKRKRKAPPKDILPCTYDGCEKIFSSRQYLNHHMKYQHIQQKTFSCSHPSCQKSFNFKKHLKEHEKLHSNQRDYICEFCARAFRTSSNLIIHRRIHTGEKPLQCEVCGFTCRQKASLNWHMRKHNVESSYLFPCDICGRRFEKRDNVTAHRSKSHPEHVPNATPIDVVSSGAATLPKQGQ